MRRVLSVGFAPHAIFVACLWALIRSGSFAGPGHWEDVVPATPAGVAGALLLIAACAAVLGLLLHPFQIRAVRLLEGYWDRWLPTARLAGVLIEYQRRKWQALKRIAEEVEEEEQEARPRVRMSLPEQVRDLDSARDRVRDDARRRLAAMPPGDVLLPTALGNALRAGELRAGERYGLATLASWPRIYPQLSPPLAKAVSSARDGLDAAVNLCYSFAACVLVLALALHDEPDKWWLPLLALAASALAYKGAVVATQGYAHAMDVVYDLHRFDLARALHHRPPDRESEWDFFRRVSEAFADTTTGPPYDHGRSDANEADRTA